MENEFTDEQLTDIEEMCDGTHACVSLIAALRASRAEVESLRTTIREMEVDDRF